MTLTVKIAEVITWGWLKINLIVFSVDVEVNVHDVIKFWEQEVSMQHLFKVLKKIGRMMDVVERE